MIMLMQRLLAVVLSALLSLTGIFGQGGVPSRGGEAPAFTITRAQDASLVFGTSQVRHITGEISMERFAEHRGAMLALFGEPDYVTDDAENAYQYTLLATNGAGESRVLTVYEGPSGSAIGGLAGDAATMAAADVLAEMIAQTKPADFEAVIYYGDTFSEITYGCQDGVGYAMEVQPVMPPWWED